MNGNLQWANAYGGSSPDFGYSVKQTNTGMFIVTGSTKSFGAGQEEVFLLKTNGAGTLQYFKTFGGTNQDYGYSINQISNGKYLIGGSTRSFGAGGDDVFLINTDTLGLLQFAKCYGGTNNEYGYSINETFSGQFIIGGSERSFGGGSDNAYLIKTNNTGAYIWSKSYGGGNNEALNSVNEMANSQLILLGFTKSFGVGGNDFYLIRTDTAGKSGCNEINPPTIATTPAIVTGNFSPIVSPGGVSNNPPLTLTSNFDLTTLLCQCIAPPNITGNNSICPGITTTLTASGGTVFSWSTGATTPTIAVSPTITTSYSVIVSNGICSDTTSFEVIVSPAPVINVTPASATICSGSSVLLTASGASLYAWSPGGGLSCSSCSSPTASPLSSTIYTVTGKDVNNCTNTKTISITTTPLPTITINPSAPIICIGSAVTLTASGASSYGWSPATALSCNNCPNPSASPTITTNYTITGTSSGGCVNSTSITITVNSLPTLTISPSSATLCAGTPTVYTASGANSYTWSPATGLSCTNCPSPSANTTVTTTYTVMGVDLNGCANTKTASLIINPLPVLVISPASPSLCIGTSTVLSASGATAYTWSPATGLSCTNCANPTANPTVTTNYTITGVSAAGCLNTKTISVLVNPLPVITLSPGTATLCLTTSTILTASGANSYSWSPSAGLSCTNCAGPTVSPTVSTIYTITGTDVNSCVNSSTTSVTINPLPVVNISPASATLCIGASTVLTASGATNYTWTPSAGLSCTNCASPTANPTITTTYTLTGVNANGCVNTKTLTVSVNPLPVIVISPSSPSICIGSSVTLNASGASSYTWSPATSISCTVCSSAVASPTLTSNYTITGTDANGCVNTKTISVFVNPLPVISINPSSATLCIGSPTTLVASGASTYSWSPVAGLSCTNCANPTVSATVSTVYTVTGTDANGCMNTKTVSVIINSLPIITISPASVTICLGSSTLVTASGASTYSWLPATGISCTNCANPTLNPTVATVYTVTGTNANGCVNTKTVSIIINALPVINVNPATSTICAGSSVLLSASGATSYTWSPITALSCSACSSPTASPSSNTIYSVSGTDANGCTNTQTASISVNLLPTINLTPVSATLCFGSSTVLTASGANSYVWSPFTGISCNNCPNPTVNPTITTTYTITGTDVNGCVNTKTTTVTINSLPSLTISPASSSICIGTPVSLLATGANAYTWTPSAGLSCSACANPIANPTVSTTYTIIGINVNGCVGTKTILINVNSLPVITSSPSLATICLGGSTVITASGAVNYSWSPLSGLSCYSCSSPTASPTANTVYTITGTDINGCVNTKTVSVTVNPLPVISINPSTVTLCLGSSTVMTASGASTYVWSPFSGLSCNNCSSPVVNPTVTTNYTVTGIDLNGCSQTQTATAIINASLALTISPSSATICSGNSTTLSASGATGYFWSPSTGLSCNGCSNPVASPTITTNYTLTGTAASGCVSTKTILITVNPLPSINISPSSSTLCIGSSTVLTAVGASNYTWFPAAGLSCTNCASPTASPTNNVVYTVYGTDANGCSDTKTTTIVVISLPLISVSTNPFSGNICAGNSATLTSSGANSYTWSPIATLSCINCSISIATPTSNTTFTVGGTDANGCVNTKTVLINVNSLPVINTSPSTATICSGGSVILSVNGGNSYTWSPAIDLSCSNCVSPTASPSITTTYSVIGSNTNGCISTATTAITVDLLPTINVNQSSFTLCSGSSTVLTASGATNYTWSPAIGLSCISCTSPTANPLSNTIYTVSGNNGNGCSNTATVSIFINSLPLLNVNPTSTIVCSGTSVNITASGATAYAWNPLTGLSCSSCTNAIATPTINTTYSVTGFGTNGCSTIKTVQITVYALPNLVFSPPSATLCVGSTTLALVFGANNYTWAPANGLSCNACSNPSVSPLVSTVYTVTGKDGNGCINSKTYNVIVGQPITGSITGDSTVCFGSSITLQAQGGTTYSWSNGANTSLVAVSPTINTTYSVIISQLGCKDTVLRTIKIFSVPLVYAGADLTLHYGASVSLNGFSTNTTNLNWSPQSNLSCYNCLNPVANPTISTLYTLTSTNQFGCKASDSLYIIVDAVCGDVFVPNVFSPNGDGQNDILYVENRCLLSIEFIIYDRWGEKMFESNDPKQGWDGTYKGEQLNGGGFVYYLRARLINQEGIVIKKGNILILR